MAVEPGSIFTAQVKVAGFRKIVGVQYSMTWNPSVLRFEAIVNPALGMSVNDNFGQMNVNSGVLTLSWFDQTLNGVTLPDSAVLYGIRFEAIGSNGSQSGINFGSVPTIQEVSDTSFAAIAAGYHNGVVLVMTPSAVRDSETTTKVQISECVPNPIKDKTFFSIEAREAVTMDWGIFDTQGRRLYASRNRYGVGKHTLEVSADMLESDGTYYCRFFLDDGTVISRKLMKI